MKLWLLQPIHDLPESTDPWEPWYDKTFGFVVRAETEEQARQFAHDEGANENRSIITTKPWKDARYSTCVELSEAGEPGVIIEDHCSA